MAKKFGEPGENLVQGAGRFGGSMGEMAPVRASGLTTAERNALKNEAIQENVKRDIAIAKKAPERKAALKAAKTENKDGVKVTEYPYVEPSKKRQGYRSLDDTLQHLDDVEDMGMKKGGSVSSASKRADGCALRGKTRA
jgi:hypothetical protein